MARLDESASSPACPPLVVVVGDLAEGSSSLRAARSILREQAAVLVATDPSTVRWFGGPPPVSEAVPAVGNVRIAVEPRQVFVDEHVVALSDGEYRLLLDLLAHAGCARSFDDLSIVVTGSRTYGDTSALRSTVKRLRRKLRLDGASVVVESVRGFGFRAAVSRGSVGTQLPQLRP